MLNFTTVKTFKKSCFKEEEKIKSGVTLDTMWYLNGEYRLNGKRKLNAAIIKVYYDD